MLSRRRFWIGIVVTAGFAVILVLQLDLANFFDALAEANYLLLVPSVAVYFVSLYLRAVRWRYLLKPFAVIDSSRLYPVVIVGFMVNNVFPMRIGEFARSYYLSLREQVKSTTGLVTVIVERVFDGLTLILFLLAGAVFLPVFGLTGRLSEAMNIPVWAITAAVITPFALALLLMTVASLRSEMFIATVVKLTKRLPTRYQGAVRRFAEQVILGFDGLHRPDRLGKVMALSIPVWIAEVSAYWIVAVAFDLHSQLGGMWLTLVAILVVVAVSNLSNSIPSSPGSVGPFEFFTAISLIFLGVASSSAYAYAIVLHLGLILPTIAAGLIHLTARSVSINQLVARQGRETRQ